MAVQEIDSGLRRDGLWAKAVLLGNLDERQTKLAYLRLLVQHLKDERYVSGRVNQQREEERRRTDQEQEVLRRQQKNAATPSPISRARSLVATLRQRDLNFDQYKDLAAIAGAEFSYRGFLRGSWQVKLIGKTTEFKRFGMLRPWFLDNIAPRVEA